MRSVWPQGRFVRKYSEVDPGHSRATIFVILLAPAIGLGALSLWLFVWHWVAIAVFVVGLFLAVAGSTHRLRSGGVVVLVAAELFALVLTAILALAVDCGLHCS